MANEVVDIVFDNARTLINAGQSFTETFCNTVDALQNPSQPSEYSRRKLGYNNGQQYAMAPQVYQPADYPWAPQTIPMAGNYGFGNQPQMYMGFGGYPGISNPNYGMTGFYNGFQGTGAWGPQSGVDRGFGSIGGFQL